MCSAFTPDCGSDNSTTLLIGDVSCPKTRSLGKLRLHTKPFQSLGRSDYQCPECGFVCQVRNIPFEDQTNSFFLSLGQGVYIFEVNPKSVQDFNGDVYCPGKYCFNREICEGGYVKTPRSIYACGKCGDWLFVHKVHFMLQEPVKTTKTEKARFFSLLEKDEFDTQQTTTNYSFHFNQPFIERKKYVGTTKYERLSEMCFVQHVELKGVFSFQLIKRLVSTTVRNAKPAATF